MANEIRKTISMQVTTALGASLNTQSLSDSIDQAGADLGHGTQVLSTSPSQLIFNSADINGEVHFVCINRDEAATVTIGDASPVVAVLSKLGPGEACSLARIDCDKIFFDADSGTPRIEWWMTEV